MIITHLAFIHICQQNLSHNSIKLHCFNAGLNCYCGMCLANSVPKGRYSHIGTSPRALNFPCGFFLYRSFKYIYIGQIQYWASLDRYIWCVRVYHIQFLLIG